MNTIPSAHSETVLTETLNRLRIGAADHRATPAGGGATTVGWGGREGEGDRAADVVALLPGNKGRPARTLVVVVRMILVDEGIAGIIEGNVNGLGEGRGISDRASGGEDPVQRHVRRDEARGSGLGGGEQGSLLGAEAARIPGDV